jgi:hypothetical protein
MHAVLTLKPLNLGVHAVLTSDLLSKGEYFDDDEGYDDLGDDGNDDGPVY